VNGPARADHHAFAAEAERDIFADAVDPGHKQRILVGARPQVGLPFVDRARLPVGHDAQQLRAVQRQRPRHFRKGQVPAKQQADGAELGFQHRDFVPFAEGHAFLAAQVDLVVYVDQLAVRPNQHRAVVQHALDLLLRHHAEGDIDAMLVGPLRHQVDRRPRHALGNLREAHAQLIAAGHQLREDDQVNPLLRGNRRHEI